MLLRYKYKPAWSFDETDKKWWTFWCVPHLFYSNDEGKTWLPVPVDEYPSPEEENKLREEFPHP